MGNGGTDGDPNTLMDDQPYMVGFKDPNLLQPLADGGTFQVPAGVTVEIDAGAVSVERAGREPVRFRLSSGPPTPPG